MTHGITSDTASSSGSPRPVIPFDDLLGTVDWPARLGPPPTWSHALQAALTLLKSTTTPLLLLIGSENFALFNPAHAQALGVHPDAFGKAMGSPPKESLIPLYDCSTGSVLGALWIPLPPPLPPPQFSRQDEMLKKMAASGAKEGRHGVKACVDAMVGVLKDYGVKGVEVSEGGNKDINDGTEVGNRLVAVGVGKEEAEVMSEAIATAKALELSRAREEALEESQRAKMTFYANCSYKFRTPLELVLGPVEDILAEVKKGRWTVSDEVMERLEMVKKGGADLLKLVDSLLLFSAIGKGGLRIRPRPTNLADQTREVAARFESNARRFGLALDIECTPEAEQERVYIGKDMYLQILLNLLSNAFKSTLNGGVQVRLSIEEMDGVEQPVMGEDGTIASVDPPSRRGFATLRVSDTGAGIAAEHLEKIFDRFYTVPYNLVARSLDGAGIGLHLVSEIVKAHGGTITAESKEGSGSTFTVRIPTGSDHFRVLSHDNSSNNDADGGVHDQEPANVSQAPSAIDMFVNAMDGWAPHPSGLITPSGNPVTSAPQAAKVVATTSTDPSSLSSSSSLLDGERPSTVLLVEDNPDMLKFLAQLLVKEKFHVLTASNGEGALRIATDIEDIDMVLTDQIMPVMGGLELIRKLRENAKTQLVPIILLTERMATDDAVDAFEAGADGYLTKPFLPRELVARVTLYCNLHRMRIKALIADREVQALEYANEAKAKFLSLVSHEMRTPLFSITGNVELLQHSTLNNDQRSHLVTINQSSHDLLALIQDVLDIGRLDASDDFSFEAHNFNPREVFHSIVEILTEKSSAAKIGIRSFADADVPECVCADLKRIYQVISKLVSNAVKFSEKPGATVNLKMSMRNITVSKSETETKTEKKTEIKTETEGEGEAKLTPALYVECCDNGIGMNSTEHIFKPFWQANIGATRQYGGSGLGLTIAKQLVEKAGGKMDAESELNKGSKVWFTWPVVIPSAEEHDRHHHTDVSTALGTSQEQGPKPKKRMLFPQTRNRSDSTHKSAGDFLMQIIPRRSSPGGRSPKSPPESPRTSYFQERSGSKRTTKSNTTSPAVSPSETPRREPHTEGAMALTLPGKARLQQIRVLLAEDNLINRQLMVRQLQMIGFRHIDTANNGQEVLNLVKDKVALGENGVTGKEGYHLILMDIDMPIVSGHDATSKIRKIDHPLSSIPIIAVTANAYASDRQKCIEVGMSDFVPKPVFLEELKSVIARWI